MKRLLLAAALATLAACRGPSLSDITQCQHDLGSAEGQLTAAKASQAAAEAKLAAVEERLQSVREELAVAQKAADDAVRSMAQAEVERVPAATPARPRAGQVEQPRAMLRVGLSLPTQREERWVKDKLTMIAEARRRGIDLRVKVSDLDAAQQQAQCEQLLAEGIKVLILAPHDTVAAAAIVEKAARAGVKVVSYDRLVTGSPRDYYYVSFDNVKVGELQGRWIAEKAPRGTYLVLSGAPSDHNAKLFRQGALRVLQPLIDRGEVKVALDQPVKDWAPAEAQRLCEGALGGGATVDAILAPNDGTAGGCIEALRAHGLAGKVPITGQDAELAAALRINEGTQGMTVFKDTRLLGRKAIEMAADLARGKPVDTRGRTISNERREIPAVLLPAQLVTRENLDEVLVRSGYLPAEAVYRQ